MMAAVGERSIIPMQLSITIMEIIRMILGLYNNGGIAERRRRKTPLWRWRRRADGDLMD